MTQFTFSELKPRIIEAIRLRMNHHHIDNNIDAKSICRMCRELYWNNEPIELVGFISKCISHKSDGSCTTDESYCNVIDVRAIGQHTGQIYTWSLKSLLPELREDSND